MDWILSKGPKLCQMYSSNHRLRMTAPLGRPYLTERQQPITTSEKEQRPGGSQRNHSLKVPIETISVVILIWFEYPRTRENLSVLVYNQYVSYRGQHHTIRRGNHEVISLKKWSPKFCLWPINGLPKASNLTTE